MEDNFVNIKNKLINLPVKTKHYTNFIELIFYLIPSHLWFTIQSFHFHILFIKMSLFLKSEE